MKTLPLKLKNTTLSKSLHFSRLFLMGLALLAYFSFLWAFTYFSQRPQ